MVCQSPGTIHDFHTMFQRCASPDSPMTSRDLRYSGRISSTPGALPLRNTSVTSAKWISLCFFHGRCDIRFKEILIFIISIPSTVWQYPLLRSSAPNPQSVGGILLPLPEVLDGLPAFLQAWLVVLHSSYTMTSQHLIVFSDSFELLFLSIWMWCFPFCQIFLSNNIIN